MKRGSCHPPAPPMMTACFTASWLNLWYHFRLPKKVRILIYSKLTSLDRALVEHAHGVLNFKSLIVKSIRSGDLEALRWAYSIRSKLFHDLSNKEMFDFAVSHSGVSHSGVSVIRWMFETLVDNRDYDAGRKFIFCRSAIAGNIALMEWALFFDSLDWLNSTGRSGKPVIDSLLEEITFKGHLHVLKWFENERRIRKNHYFEIKAVANFCSFNNIVDWIDSEDIKY